eukprot:TRINITY_DN11897_c0_g1_i1.p1 TRINITY_DN11897_c0_g1~~TRINITY_DN11897_c0_g1_i1.p1  ORF type:complete len:565 (-),score=165.33 TRINITY_DN11897_c0_g1_i1:574-2217(-)
MSKRSKKGGLKNPPAVEVPKDQITQNTLCQFCHMGETKDILQSGRLYKLTSGKTTEYYHYFCLLFSSHGVQKGKDEEGLNGFLAEDIRKEVKRGESIKCDFCDNGGATIPCHRKSCKKNYHFPCGSLCTTPGEHYFIFRNNMDSFCYSHAPKQTKVSHVVKDSTCMVCLSSIANQNPDTADSPVKQVCLDNSFTSSGPGPGRLVSPCCGRTFHRDCVQKTALQAGKAALKCPACSTKDRFNEEMERCGIYIPHADAQWEMPENSNFYRFDDMLHMYRKCDAPTCTCPRGRENSRPGSQYEVIKCETCGQSGVHIACGGLEFRNPLYVCETCQPQDSTENSDSDDSCDDELVKEALLRHEEKRLRLIAEKNRLIEEERKRLEKTKNDQVNMINQIKSIFSSSEPSSSDADIQYFGSQRGSRPPQAMIQPYRPRYATHMPRKLINTEIVTLDDSDGENSNDTSGIVLNHEEEPVESVLKIEKVFCGEEASKIDNLNPALADVVFDSKEHSDENADDDDSDIEIIDMPVANKKPRVLQEILKELQEDPNS